MFPQSFSHGASDRDAVGHCGYIVHVVYVGFAFVFSVVFSTYCFGLEVLYCERVVRYFYKPLNHISATVVFPGSLALHAV